ncbi:MULTISPECIES: hypothetical protein [Cysteiniphilum]|uniref:Uncharacterized protein n=1 Tax=Cysteiniphilum litorale TaxID=2056700 RepID=A0A8J2Z6G2_9GAMM|nr:MULTISPECIES: hypothetical protein [Cysteiniphilum]GGG06121.1 hypothetical protein GCM10010995_24500 [Cysteiniphilum litorale]
MIFYIEKSGAKNIKIGTNKTVVREILSKQKISYTRDYVANKNTEFEEKYDVINDSHISCYISYDQSENICFIDIDRPSTVVMLDFFDYKNLFNIDFFELYAVINSMDVNLVVTNRGFISKKYMFGVHAPSFECRYRNDEEGYEDYPEGEDGWSGEIASIYIFNSTELKKLLDITHHDQQIKDKIDEYLVEHQKMKTQS